MKFNIEDDYMENNRNVLGPNIKYFRKKLGLTQEDLTARLQVQGISIDRPMISKIENQTRELLDYELIAIANILRIGVEELVKSI